jgi:hypothetical protein
MPYNACHVSLSAQDSPGSTMSDPIPASMKTPLPPPTKVCMRHWPINIHIVYLECFLLIPSCVIVMNHDYPSVLLALIALLPQGIIVTQVLNPDLEICSKLKTVIVNETVVILFGSLFWITYTVTRP